jgi:hypothetical protein
VKGSTHFRTLFLAALTLFAMTFILNTVAETIRLRFRKRFVVRRIANSLAGVRVTGVMTMIGHGY